MSSKNILPSIHCKSDRQTFASTLASITVFATLSETISRGLELGNKAFQPSNRENFTQPFKMD